MKESFFVTGSRLEFRISRKRILNPAQRLPAAAALANLGALKRHALEELINDEDNDVVEDDRPVLETCLVMTQTEFALLFEIENARACVRSCPQLFHF
jgi:hypothetical protein